MKHQAPKGTRDFYPPQMAWRNYLQDAWRRVSIRHGFEPVDGPIFESLDLYKIKSGEGIVSELFHFKDRGDRDLAIRPEFTPTLARMVAAKANALPKPIKWFCLPNLCRAERPQRGRLREFDQWNCDVLGSDSPVADAECMLVAVDLLETLGLTRDDVRVKISHRGVVKQVLTQLQVPGQAIPQALELLDQRAKVTPDEFNSRAQSLGLSPEGVAQLDEMSRRPCAVGGLEAWYGQAGVGAGEGLAGLDTLDAQLCAFGLASWCEYDLSIVRGLAYYTGTVFEIHETSGAERALAGGGRYDQLIELFGGPATPAVGFGMGDVVLTNVLEDKGLIPAEITPQPDIFVITPDESAAQSAPGLVAGLRRLGVHTRFSYKTTRNLGKLLKEAHAAQARYALILDQQVAQHQATLKNLADGDQETIPTEPDQIAKRVAFGNGAPPRP